MLDFDIEFDREDDGRWIAEIVGVPGVLAYGLTREEAQRKVDVLAEAVFAERETNS
jgi:predicted RNase H-like HicB family nuclease